ncbi:hypothetical protein G7Y89_g3626 [Cudoniella acicularis]|uniref:Uncharacterized protein n=1 Tax=Cudoniella acicularis TaxID=354080 RepID=A0A8H4RT11_9HELO|nr:hypothetical protein G7Y89_g3626 [Cudoniella acicularis]
MASQAVDLSENRSTEIIVVAWVFTGIAIATVALKLFSRAQIVKVIDWDDFFIFFVCGAFSFPNVSIAIPANRLLDPNVRRSRCLYLLVTLQALFAIVPVLIAFLMCNPSEKLWNSSVPSTFFNVVPLVLWGLVEQNLVTVAACIPTLRLLFHKVFKSTRSRSTENNSHSVFKLTSKAALSSKHTGSVLELPLDERQGHHDDDSNNSQKGIWRARNFAVAAESDEDIKVGKLQCKTSTMIPNSLRD